MSDKISYINLNPEKPALDGRHLDQLIELWKEDLKRRVKAVSCKNGTTVIRFFSDWWRATGNEYKWLLTEIALADYVRYLAGYRTQRGTIMTVHTQILAVTTLKAMFRWSFRSGYVSTDFSPFVPRPKGKPEPRKAISLDDLSGLLQQAAKTAFPIRNQAIIAVMAGTGVRCMECAALTIGAVSTTFDRVGTIHLSVTKGNKPRIVVFDRFTGEYLDRHLDTIAGQLPSAPLFSTKDGRSFKPNSLGSLISDIADEAGMLIRAHDLRRLFATHWARERPGEGYGQLLQKQMGHSSFDMTTQYMLQDTEDLVHVMRKEAISPMAALHGRHKSSTT